MEGSNFTGYELLTNTTSYIVPPNSFGHTNSVMAKIYAVANIESGVLSDEQGNPFITNEADLVNFQYYPQKEVSRDITQIPEDGMPMFGAYYNSSNTAVQSVNINTPQTVKILMMALMARIDVSFSLNYNQAPNPSNPNWPNF